MPITTVTPPNSSRLTTVDAVAEQLQLDVADIPSQQERIRALIDRASSFVSNYTNQVFGERQLTETLVSPNTMPQMGGFRLVLSGTPIKEVTEVKHLDVAIDSDYYFIEDPGAGFLFHKYRFSSSTVYTGPIVLQPTRYGKYDWEVTYTCGYKLPGEEDRDFPYDLEMAVIQLINSYHQSQGKPTSVSREDIGNASVWYTSAMRNNEVPRGAMEVIERYKDIYS